MMMQGIVIKSTGKWYKVATDDEGVIDCQIRGKFRIKGLRTTNPIAVGDHVDFEKLEDGTGLIHAIGERTNYIIRRSVNLSKEAHIVASNIDVAFLVITLVSPPTSSGFIDRFIIAAEAYNVPVCLVFNKTDLYDEEMHAQKSEWMDLYASIGYDVIELSAVTGKGVEALQERMKGKVSMFSGHSGVGKSTLINAVQPGLEIRTMEVSDYHQKGMHTTTFAEMHPLDFGGYIIDTPGIKGFGLVDIPKEELHHFFKEFFALLPECKFHNCLHLNEPGCAVKEALDQGKVSESRYRNYVMMYDTDEGQAYR